MKDEDKTKEQLVHELAAMRQRIAEIESNYKRAEEALRESEERYRQLVEQPFDGVFIRSQDKILFMNKAGARMLGTEDPSQFVGKSVLDFLHPDYHEFVRKRVQEVYETGKFVPLVEEKFIRFDGKVIDVEVAATAFTYGGSPAVQVIFRDITERKQAEQELRKSQEMLKNITHGISDTILLISKDFRILWANKAALGAYGSGIMGDYCYKATHHKEYQCEPPLDPCPISELEKTGKPVLMHHIHIDEHSNKRHVEVGAYPVMDEKGEISQFVHVCQDITERKRSEEEREQLVRELQEALSKAKTLSGFLPICASCKKIRDDKGYWNQIEVYIRDHSEAEFSHGICPDCKKKLYGDFF